jgi:hypothetical protein
MITLWTSPGYSAPHWRARDHVLAELEIRDRTGVANRLGPADSSGLGDLLETP